jgi:hypothetical protein
MKECIPPFPIENKQSTHCDNTPALYYVKRSAKGFSRLVHQSQPNHAHLYPSSSIFLHKSNLTLYVAPRLSTFGLGSMKKPWTENAIRKLYRASGPFCYGPYKVLQTICSMSTLVPDSRNDECLRNSPGYRNVGSRTWVCPECYNRRKGI